MAMEISLFYSIQPYTNNINSSSKLGHLGAPMAMVE